MLSPEAKRKVRFINGVAGGALCWQRDVAQAGQPGSDRTSVGGMRVTMKASAECDRRGGTGHWKTDPKRVDY
jgi:hypothetical protein